MKFYSSLRSCCAVVAALLLAPLSGVAQSSSTLNIPLQIVGLPSWTEVNVDPAHPYWQTIVAKIQTVGNSYAALNNPYRPALLNQQVSFLVVNEARHWVKSNGETVSIYSEHVDVTPNETLVIFYNPNGPVTVVRGDHDATTMDGSFQGQGPGSGTPPPQDPARIERTVHHEMGHVLWGKMTPYQREIWELVWQTTINLGVAPKVPFGKKVGNRVIEANYYAENAMEGFCCAFEIQQTGGQLDSSITNFLNNLKVP